MYKMRVQTTEYQEVITIRAAKLLGLGALTRALNYLFTSDLTTLLGSEADSILSSKPLWEASFPPLAYPSIFLDLSVYLVYWQILWIAVVPTFDLEDFLQFGFIKNVNSFTKMQYITELFSNAQRYILSDYYISKTASSWGDYPFAQLISFKLDRLW